VVFYQSRPAPTAQTFGVVVIRLAALDRSGGTLTCEAFGECACLPILHVISKHFAQLESPRKSRKGRTPALSLDLPRAVLRFWKGCKPNFVFTLASGENHLSQQPVPGTRTKVGQASRLTRPSAAIPCRGQNAQQGISARRCVLIAPRSAPRSQSPRKHARRMSYSGRGAGRSKVPYLALHPMGFSVPPRLRLERWALTPPFHPYPALAKTVTPAVGYSA